MGECYVASWQQKAPSFTLHSFARCSNYYDYPGNVPEGELVLRWSPSPK